MLNQYYIYIYIIKDRFISYCFSLDSVDEDKILAEGMTRFCADLRLDPASVTVLIIAWKLNVCVHNYMYMYIIHVHYTCTCIMYSVCAQPSPHTAASTSISN